MDRLIAYWTNPWNRWKDYNGISCKPFKSKESVITGKI